MEISNFILADCNSSVRIVQSIITVILCQVSYTCTYFVCLKTVRCKFMAYTNLNLKQT